MIEFSILWIGQFSGMTVNRMKIRVIPDGLRGGISVKNSTERFSDRVEDYVKYRPGYPKQFIDYLFAKTGLSEDSVIADIGSGTGILTALLLEKGGFVIGVEPNKEMREAAESLLKDFPKFISTDGTAENTKLEAVSVDFIICAQAFHWFEKNACRKEFQRILKPGGKVILVWNNRIVRESGFSAGYEDLLRTYANDYKEVNHTLITEDDFRSLFKNQTYGKITFPNEQIFDFEGLRGRLLSSSYSPVPGEKNYEPLMTGLGRLFEKYSQDGRICFEYETEAYIGEL